MHLKSSGILLACIHRNRQGRIHHLAWSVDRNDNLKLAPRLQIVREM